jgi:hypothetical protein
MTDGPMNEEIVDIIKAIQATSMDAEQISFNEIGVSFPDGRQLVLTVERA